MKSCVYTCLTGNYETLNEQPVASDSKIDFICLTDNPELKSSSWKIKVIDLDFIGDSVRSQRTVKILPHLYLKEYEKSLYIDNSVVLKEAPEKLFEKYLSNFEVAIPLQSFRETVLDEFLTLLEHQIDDSSRILEQLNHYSIYYPEILKEKTLQTAIIFRNHNSKEVISASERWHSQVLRFSKRDQLSVNLGLESLSEKLSVFNIDNFNSDFHSWANSINRKSKNCASSYFENMPGFAQLRHRDIKISELGNTILSLEAKNEDLQLKLAESSNRSNILDKELSDCKKELEHKVKELQSCEVTIKNLAESKQSSDHLINTILASKSWKLTSYVRNIASFIRMAKLKKEEIPFATCSNSRRIYVSSNDERGKRLIQCLGDFNPKSLSLWKKLLEEYSPDYVFDIGANYGEMIINLDTSKYKKIILLEPNPDIRKYLIKSLKEAKIKTTVLPFALAKDSGKIEIEIDHTWSGLTGISGTKRETDGHNLQLITVQAISLGDLFERYVPDYNSKLSIKIDIEGTELSVLRNSLQVLSKYKNYSIMIECLHMSQDELDWLSQNFKICLYNLEKNSLDEFAGNLGIETLSSGIFYNQDLVLKPKS